MKTVPFWTDQYPRPEDIVLSQLPEQVDVAIVGSGYTGLNAAIELSKSGASVAVLEQETIGWGASSRNGSMLSTGLRASLEWIAKRYGIDFARDMWKWSLDAIDYVEEVVNRENINCDFLRTGSVYLAYKPDHLVKIKKYSEYLSNEIGYEDCKIVEPDQLGAEIGSTAFYGGMLEKRAGRVNPAKFTFGLARAAVRYSTQLVERARVTQISRQHGSFVVTTTQGKLKSKEILLATGGYTTNLVPQVRQGIFPIGSYIIVTEPLSKGLQDELSPNLRMFYDSKRFLNYFCLIPDGRMLFGGRTDLSTSLDLRKTADKLRNRMVEVFPQLEDVPITHSWTGKLGISFDQMPHIGRVKGIHYAYGYSGHGLSIASLLGREVGQLLAGQRDSSPFMEIKHPRYFFASLDKLYLPFVSAYFRLEDRLS
jgi:glycine/D-amino acid oxidase-like deaminating enzyme